MFQNTNIKVKAFSSAGVLSNPILVKGFLISVPQGPKVFSDTDETNTQLMEFTSKRDTVYHFSPAKDVGKVNKTPFLSQGITSSALSRSWQTVTLAKAKFLQV